LSTMPKRGKQKAPEGSKDDKKQKAAAAASKEEKKDDSTTEAKTDGGHPKLNLFTTPTGACLSYVIIYTSDMKRSVNFYRDVYGFQIRGKDKDKIDDHWTELDAGHTAIAIHKGTSAFTGPKMTADTVSQWGQAQPSFFVPDLAAFEKVILKHGGTIISPITAEPWGGKKAVYADPEGIANSVVEFPTTKQ